MNENTKESKFLDAINQYAESQKEQITQEIEDYKNAKIEQATEQGLQDAYELIRSDIAKRKFAIVKDTAKRERSLKIELFSERSRIADEVFSAAEDRLRAFTQSEDYDAFLERSCKAVAQLFNEESFVVSVAPFDEGKIDRLHALLPHAEIVTDNHIRLGGIKAYCRTKGITADDTIDTRLEEQRDRFIMDSGLKVV